MSKMKKIVIALLLFLPFLSYSTNAGWQIDNSKYLSYSNEEALPELRAKLNDGSMLIIHLSPHFILKELDDINSNFDRTTRLEDGTLKIKGFRTYDEFKLGMKVKYFTKEKK